MAFALDSLDPKKVTFKHLISPGTKFVDRVLVKLDRIHSPEVNQNVVRKKGKNLPHIQILSKSLSNGIDYSKMPPVIRKKTQIINGKTYDYELICGYHRFEALKTICQYDSWIFDIYDICLDGYSFEDSVQTFKLQENNHTPALANAADDVVNAILYLIEKGSVLVEAEEASIDNYVNLYCSNLHWQTQGKIIRRVIAASGAYQDVVTYTANDLDNWLSSNTDYKMSGVLDKKRKKYGYTCLTRYEPDTLFSAMKAYSDHGKESYIIGHTSAPTKDSTVDDKRQKMADNFERWETFLKDVIKFHNNNGRFPWVLEGFAPQDRKKPEDFTKIIPASQFKKTKKAPTLSLEELLS